MRNMFQVVLITSMAVASFGCSSEATANAGLKPVKGTIFIPSRTLLKVILIDGLNSDISSTGDTFLASLAEPIVVDGIVVLDSGTIFSGLVFNSLESGLITGNSSIGFALTGIKHGSHFVAITTNSFSATGVGRGKRDREVVSGGAGLGGAGNGFAFSVKGREIHYGPETRLNFTLTNSVTMSN